MSNALRLFLIAFSLICGIALVFLGWLPTGKISGLALMILGIALLILSLYLYNKKYSIEI